MKNIPNELLSFVTQQLPQSPDLTSETDLIENQYLDSLLIMDIISFVEGRFRVRLQADDVSPANFQTLDRLAGLIDQRMKAA